jgi:RNA polymerase sigma factor (sigma-70 family)
MSPSASLAAPRSVIAPRSFGVPRSVVAPRSVGVPLQRHPGEAPDSVVERLSVVDLLNELPPRRRAVLVLRFCCDMSIEQTARALGCSTGTVKSQTARALATLRDRMMRAGL